MLAYRGQIVEQRGRQTVAVPQAENTVLNRLSQIGVDDDYALATCAMTAARFAVVVDLLSPGDALVTMMMLRSLSIAEKFKLVPDVTQ